MSASLSEQAIVQAARAVFRATGMRERIERMSDLKRAVEAFELHALAGAVGGLTPEDRFREALFAMPTQAGSRAYNLYRSRFDTVDALAALSRVEVEDIPGAGPSVIAAWRSALARAGLDPRWVR